MKKKHLILNAHLGALTLLLAATMPVSWAQEEFDETKIFIEMNATDGDAGLHALLDAEAWMSVSIDDPDGERIFLEDVKGNLMEQGLTENFFESAEPLCAPDAEDPEEEVVPLSEFLERFLPGEYLFAGTTIEGDTLEGTATLTFDLPAAPDISMFDGTENVDPANALMTWAAGMDLGEKCHDDDLVTGGIITDPALVNIVGWEVVVEPADEEAIDPFRVFSVQLPPELTSVTVSPEYLNSFPAGTEFKFEVGAIEASGNQTFSEGGFSTLSGPVATDPPVVVVPPATLSSSSGCTVGPSDGTVDPTLPLLMLISLGYLLRRRLSET